MNNQYLKDMADGISNMPDEHKISISGKQFKDMMIGLLEFSDSLLDSQKHLFEIINGCRKLDPNSPKLWGEGEIEVMK